MTLKRVFFLALFIFAVLAMIPVQNSFAHGDHSGGVHSFIDTKTTAENGGSSSVVIEQKIISNSNSNSTIVREYKSENGKVIIDKTYTSDNEASSLQDLEDLEAKDAQKKIDDAKKEIKEQSEEADKTAEEVTRELENLEEDINSQVEERMEDLEQDQRSWWARFRSWLDERLEQIRES